MSMFPEAMNTKGTFLEFTLYQISVTITTKTNIFIRYL